MDRSNVINAVQPYTDKTKQDLAKIMTAMDQSPVGPYIVFGPKEGGLAMMAMHANASFVVTVGGYGTEIATQDIDGFAVSGFVTHEDQYRRMMFRVSNEAHMQCTTHIHIKTEATDFIDGFHDSEFRIGLESFAMHSRAFSFAFIEKGEPMPDIMEFLQPRMRAGGRILVANQYGAIMDYEM